jgi:hypothetical protein
MPVLRPRFLLVATALVGAVACYEDPQQKLDQMQQLIDIGDALNQLGMQTSELQGTVDSLRMVIARQDTVIYRMANVTGIPYSLR